jgi:CubicO group peptidase (beta-lactamase class C family)
MSGLESLHGWLDDRAGQDLFSGVALVTSEGESVFEHAAGWAHRGHRVPVSTQTRFQVASMTKMITAATAMRLVEKGALRLDRPLVDFLPPELRPAALDSRHTLHHLLSHTSGVPGYHDHDDETWGSFTAAWERVPPWRARGPKDLLPLFADLPAEFEPGARFSYCDSNFILIGALVEWVTGKDFATIASQEVLGPAGLESIEFSQLDLEPADLASSYLVTEEPAEFWRSNIYSVPGGAMTDGGMISTASDLVRFYDSLAGGDIVSADSVSLMLTPHGVEPDSPEAYGYGMELVVVEGEVAIVGHSGADPGVSTMLSHFVAEDISIVVLCNHDRGSWAVVQRIEEELGLEDPRD